MLASDYPNQKCSIARTLELIGERWTLLILRDVFSGRRRFDEIQESLGVARNVLTARLSSLVDDEILFRHRYQEHPERFEYRLTEKGLDLYPVLLTIMDWGAKHGGGKAMELTHKHCGATVMPQLACPECGERVEARDMRAQPREALRQSA